MSSSEPRYRAHTGISVPNRFNFWRTVYSHGWCTLPPFHVQKEGQELVLILRLRDGQVVHCTLREKRKKISITVECATVPTPLSLAEVRTRVRECFRLNEDLSGFYSEVRKHPLYRWILQSGSGRLLRSPTVFEDVVKMLCTTNCTWALTRIMVENLVKKLGDPFGEGLCAFPTAAAMAGVGERFMRKEIRSGYRSPYLVEFAERVASGKLDVESWRNSPLSTIELFHEVGSVKGIGPYAAGNLLRLLGRYDYLALDSWVRAQFAHLHNKGRRVSDGTIEKKYRKFGKWRGLFFWFEMTKHWLDDKFPL